VNWNTKSLARQESWAEVLIARLGFVYYADGNDSISNRNDEEFVWAMASFSLGVTRDVLQTRFYANFLPNNKPYSNTSSSLLRNSAFSAAVSYGSVKTVDLSSRRQVEDLADGIIREPPQLFVLVGDRCRACSGST
jgi:hypothetical protein